MRKNLTEFLQDKADSLRDLAKRAPDIANELRRFADDLEQEATRVGHGRPPIGRREEGTPRAPD